MVVPPHHLPGGQTVTTLIAQDKIDLRRDLRARRRAFVESADSTQLGVHAIVIARIALAAAGEAKSITAYFADPREVDAMPVIQLAIVRGIVTALPHFRDRDTPMRFLRWQPGDRLESGPYAIPQPLAAAEEITPDAIITPLIGFDRAGNRLGQGAGFYDDAFATYPDARRVGLAWAVQEVERVPVDSWDQPLHAVVTERERIDFL